MVSPGALQHLLKEDSIADNHVNHLSGPSGRKGADLHVPPALEIGIAESGQLAVSSAPAPPIAASHVPSQHSTLDLTLDFALLDTESLLLRAAAANSGVQLGREASSLKPRWHWRAASQAER